MSRTRLKESEGRVRKINCEENDKSEREPKRGGGTKDCSQTLGDKIECREGKSPEQRLRFKRRRKSRGTFFCF